jgi:hypothetical protein
MISNPEKTIGDDITSSREPWLGDSVALSLRKLGVSGPTAGEVGRLRGCGLDSEGYKDKHACDGRQHRCNSDGAAGRREVSSALSAIT